MAEDTRQVNDAVLEGLEDDDPVRRRLAVRTLGRLGHTALLKAIDDEDADVRVEAVFGAAVAGMGEALPAILSRQGDGSTNVRTAVALALGLYATPDTLQPLIAMLRDADAGVRIAACYSLARLQDADAAITPLIEILKDDELTVAGAATYALSRLSANPNAVSLPRRFEIRRELVLLAKHPEPGIRVLVAEGLYKPLAGPQADTLAELMRDSDERDVLMAIIRATSFRGAPTFVVHEVTLLHNDEHIVLATIRGLSRLRGPQVNQVLIDFIVNDQRNWLQAEAIRALGVADGSTAVDVANGLTKDDDPVILAATAEALYGRHEPEAGEYAARLWESTHPWVRYHTIPAMACTTEPLTRVFAEIFAAASIEEKIQMARAAGYRLGLDGRTPEDYDDALDLLENLWGIGVHEEALALQVAVIDAAARGARPGGAELIRRAVVSSDAGIRYHAASRLEAGFGQTVEVAPPEAKPLSYYEEIVDWARRRHAAIVTVFRPGFDPGAFTLALDSERAPMTAWRFAKLAERGYYNQRRIEDFIPGLRLHAGRGGLDSYNAESWRAEPTISTFPPGTLAAVGPGPETLLGEWMITMNSRPNYLGRYWPFGRVAQFLPGVVGNVLPIDRIVAVNMYEGTGMEPLPAPE